MIFTAVTRTDFMHMTQKNTQRMITKMIIEIIQNSKEIPKVAMRNVRFSKPEFLQRKWSFEISLAIILCASFA